MAPPPEGARRCRRQGGCAGREALDDAEVTPVPAVACASTASAIAGSTSSADRSGARSTYATPSAKRSCTATATANASRVFPTPPIPVNVTTRCSPTRATARSRSCSRPSSDGRASATFVEGQQSHRAHASAPRRHRRDQGSPGIGVGIERIAQSPHRVRVRACAGPTLERTDRVAAQPGTLSQLLLRQTGGFSQSSESGCQRCTGHRDVPSASESRVGPPAPSGYG